MIKITIKIKKRRIALGLAVVLLLFMVVLILSAPPVPVISPIGNEGLPLSVDELSLVSKPVVEDASRLTGELFAGNREKCEDFINQLLGMYLEAKDKDFVVLFNPGGWGWNLVESSPGWLTILTGLESELDSSGYTPLLLNYRRTVDSLSGRLKELVAMITGYPSTAKDLAGRVEFLTSHIPDLRVILAGESNGSVISDRAMNILAGNPQVYSIQTGRPFWHDNITQDRTLIITDNGIIPDSFSHGHFLTMIRANLKAFFGLLPPEGEHGTLFHYVRAPGHDYWWQYPGVYFQITNFLDKNFEIK